VTSPTASREGPADLVGALQSVLSAEHAAVYGYGIVGAQLSGAEESLATAAFAGHENRRDAVHRMILDRGATPVAALSAYQPRAPVTNRASALQLAIALEEDCAAAIVAVLSLTDDPTVRRSVAGWLTDAAVRDQLWRARLSQTALVTMPALPGLKPPPVEPSPTPTPGSTPSSISSG
jgi:hypothetical protein